jgi:nitrate reductase assembly molybdenum cofactor insertion protein NarJ
MGLRLVDDGSSSGDDRAALADARQSVARARTRLEALADRLAELRRRLGEDESPGAQPTQTFEATDFRDEEKDPGRVL